MPTAYQVLVLGEPKGRDVRLRELVGAKLTELGLQQTTMRFLTENEGSAWDVRLPLMAIYFGSDDPTDTPLVADLIDASCVIVPVVSNSSQVSAEIPAQLKHVNALSLDGIGGGLERLTSLIFETFRLLRRQRRLFISYRRMDAQPFANRLYDELDARGFDVFIDVRSIPPAVDFQSELWHRMCDCDVVILIDTPGFRQSRWTTAELTQANATNVQILHLLWPGQLEDAASALSHFFKLSRADFVCGLIMRGAWTRRRTMHRICDRVESLRARAIAARQRYLIDNFCDAARDLGLSPNVQLEQWITLDFPVTGKTLAVVPAVGVPTSDVINDTFSAISGGAAKPDDLWIVYDNRGILARWLDHLDWLDMHLPVKTVRMAQAPERLKAAL